MKKIKLLLAMFMVFSCAATVSAQQFMVINQADGNTLELPISNILEVTFRDVKGDDSGDASPLVGKWVGKITEAPDTFDALLIITPDTYSVTTPEHFRNFSGTWQDNGNGTLTLTGFFDPTFKYELSGNTLILTGKGWSAIFSRQ